MTEQKRTITADDIFLRFHNSHKITQREAGVAYYLLVGKTAEQIATIYNSEKNTIEAHKYNLMRKLDVHKIAQLFHLIFDLNLGESPNSKKPEAGTLKNKIETLNVEFDNVYDLTPKEIEVFLLAKTNLKIKEIGDRLNIKIGTVKVHLKSIFLKTSTGSREELKKKFNSCSGDNPDSNLSQGIIASFWPEEQKILELLADNHDVFSISTNLNTTPQVIRAHIDSMAKTLGLKNWHQLAAIMKVIKNTGESTEKPQTQANNELPELTVT
jgi:DNA-binding NarL/FixJ family response regulator